MTRTHRSVVAVTGALETRARIAEALSDESVKYLDPSTVGPDDRPIVADVAIVDVANGHGRPGDPIREPTYRVREVVTIGDEHESNQLCVGTPVDPAALRSAMERARRRIDYAAALDEYAAAITDVDDESCLERLRRRLDRIVREFDHGDFVRAFQRVSEGA